jgi:acyl dehydratase
VPVNTGHVGRTFAATRPYEVSRHKIEEFATAIGDANPLYHDPAAAREAGYPDVVAPPTFPIVITMLASRVALADPELRLNYAMVVHGEQRFTYTRPLHAGDVVTGQSTISDIRVVGGMTLIHTETQIRTVDGENVCTGYATAVEREA